MNPSNEQLVITSQGITKIAVSGYKSIAEECAIEIRPLTILAGVNSSGKSSIIQPLLLMKQTLEAPYDPGALLLNGTNVKLTSLEQVFSKVGSQKYNEFSIKIEIDNSKYIQSIFNIKNAQINTKQMKYRVKDGTEIVWNDNIAPEEILVNSPKEIQTFVKELENTKIFNIGRMFLNWRRCFIKPYILFTYQNQDKNLEFIAGVFLSLTEVVEYCIRTLIHVPGIRGNPERSYPVTAVGQQFCGTFEYYVASIINHWQKQNSPKLGELERHLSLLGLTNQIRATKINDVQVEIEVSRLPCNSNSNGNKTDMVSIADVGFGVSQTLPAIVALLVAEPHQLVYLEQPEIHLHPRAQAAFADILVESANRGVKVVVETHSDLILKRIQSLVAEDKIEPDQIKLHWFNRDKNGCTKVTTADLDDAGTFGDWPEDFSEVDLQEESRYLDAAELKMMRNSNEEE